MNAMQQFWDQQSARARTALLASVAAIILVCAALGWWAYRTEYEVLFSSVAPEVAAAMTAELDKGKIAYRLADGGNTILVPKDLVYKTRLNLMGKELPLQGAVGFEVFNNAEFGMTEFVQKVNYQRAVQGELTRTILAIDDVLAVRVHLAVPDQGLFKKATAKTKASVTITMKPGHSVKPAQVQGIQRLVAAAVPDMLAADVTVVDQHGMALTRAVGGEAVAESGTGQLDAKRGAEEYILRKVSSVLDQTYGPGQAIASIDLVLNLDQSRITTEEVLPARPPVGDASPAGVVVRERQSQREGTAAAKDGGTEVTSTESDYQVGRRVEQVVSVPGATRRMTIAVVVRNRLDDGQIEKLKEVVGLAAGFNAQRGDAVVVYSMDRIGTGAPLQAATPAAVPSLAPVAPAAAEPLAGMALALRQPVALLLGVAILVVLVVLAWRRRVRPVAPAGLDDAQRAAMLIKVQKWVAETGRVENLKEGAR